MTEFKSYTPGTFCWVDLSTSDQAGAKKFYSQLFGWSANDIPIGENQVYSMMQIRGLDVAAISVLGEQQKGMPPHWNSYIAIANADDSAAGAAKHGGKVIAPAFDVFDSGRMAVLQDPSGAFINVWQAKKHIGASLANEPGTIVWNELYTHNPDAAGKFYQSLFGWSAKTMDMSGSPYTMFQNGERPAAGMLPMPEPMKQIPSNWVVYFGVSDCDAAADQIKKLGGSIIVPPMDIQGVGRFAMAMDPQGAAFAIIKMSS